MHNRVASAAENELPALEVECYGNGYALLRPAPERYALTDKARRLLAQERLYGPWPTVAEAQP
jgi:hypothetical protein